MGAIAKLKKEVADLRQENADLRAQLAQKTAPAKKAAPRTTRD
jgi:cell division septum initiation protein DivIVA